MKIVGINSSARKVDRPAQQESSTRLLLSHALNHIKDKAETEIIDLVDYNLKSTEGCYSTDENLCQEDSSHYDDDFGIISKKIEEADGIIFSSPTYWVGMSSRLDALFERMTEMDPIVRDVERRVLQGKVAGAIATAAVDGASAVCYDILKKANYLGFIVPPHALAFHVLGQTHFTVENKEELAKDFVAYKNAEIVAENVYKMCELVKNSHKDWSVYDELVRPLSEWEKSHKFDLQAEQERIQNEDFLNKNKEGLI